MIVHQENTKVDFGGLVAAPREFTIKASAEAYSILSSQVYTDKILAPIRELCCNARDAHVIVDKHDVPFEVQLPTALDMKFAVRDFGPGLSEEDVYELYTTYFSSNKRNSNDTIGGLGIGSKSPFAYVDGFNVISWHAGRKMTFMAFRQEDTLPAVTKVSDVPSDDDPGMEISFPVFQKDIESFKSKFAQAMEFFEPKPVTNITVNYPAAVYEVRGENWGLREEKYGFNSGSRAIMGGVAYAIPETVDNVPIPRNLDIFFPIGAVQMATSREALSLNKTTIKAVHEAVEKIRAEVFMLSKNRLNDFARTREAWQYVMKQLNVRMLYGKKNTDYYGTYANFVYDDSVGVFKEWDYLGMEVSYINGNKKPRTFYSATEASKTETLLAWEQSKITMPDFYKGEYQQKTYYFFSEFGSDYKYVVDDLRSGIRFVKRFATNTHKRVVILRGDRSVIDKFIEDMQIDEFICTSELKDTYPDTKRSYVRRGSGLKRFVCTTDSSKQSHHWTNVDVDFEENETMLYVPIERFSVTQYGYSNAYLKQAILNYSAAFSKTYGDDFVVYGLTERELKKYPDAVNFIDMVKTKLDSLPEKLVKKVSSISSVSTVPHKQRKNLANHIIKDKTINPYTRRLFLNVIRSESNKFKGLASLLQMFNKQQIEEALDTNTIITRMYPMLDSNLSYYMDDEDIHQLKEYIKMADMYRIVTIANNVSNKEDNNGSI